MQDAITALPPTVEAEAVPTLPKTVLVAPEAETEIGFVVLQVRGMPVRIIPALSVTVAFSVVEVPVFTTNDLLGFPTAPIEIDCTGQVVNCKGWLLIPLTVAKKEVEPGVLAPTIS